MARIFGLSHLDDSATPLLQSASAVSHLKPGLPPFLLVHGDKDEKVPYQADLDFRARLLALGVPCELITIHGGGHGMISWEKIAPEYKDQVVAWLKKTLPPHP